MNGPICLVCKLPALPRCYSDAGRREVAISGLCEPCFDRATLPDDECNDDDAPPVPAGWDSVGTDCPDDQDATTTRDDLP